MSEKVDCEKCGNVLTPDDYQCPQCRRYQRGVLVWHLRHGDVETRKHAAAKLVHVARHREVLDELAVALNDADAEVRLGAGVTLFAYGKDAMPITAALIVCLDHDDFRIRRVAAACLSNIGPEAREAIPKLRQLVDAQDAYLRAWVAEALNKIGAEPEN